MWERIIVISVSEIIGSSLAFVIGLLIGYAVGYIIDKIRAIRAIRVPQPSPHPSPVRAREDSELARLSTYGAQEIPKANNIKQYGKTICKTISLRH